MEDSLFTAGSPAWFVMAAWLTAGAVVAGVYWQRANEDSYWRRQVADVRWLSEISPAKAALLALFVMALWATLVSALVIGWPGIPLRAALDRRRKRHDPAR